MNNTLSTIELIVICTIVALLSFAIGKYTATPAETTTTTKTDTERTKNTNSHTVTTTVQEPTGQVKTVVVTDTNTQTETTQRQEKDTEQVSAKKDLVNIALLGGYNVLKPNGVEYGLSVSKPLLGPITSGLWVMNNGTIGLSVGINF